MRPTGRLRAVRLSWAPRARPSRARGGRPHQPGGGRDPARRRGDL